MARNMGCFASRRAAPTSAGVPLHRRLPPSSTTTRLARGKASSSRCSVRRTVVPSSRLTRPSTERNSEAAMGSSWLVGSSKIRTEGWSAITEARFSSCFCPPDSSAASRWNQDSIPKNDAISATVRRMVAVSYPRLSRPKASSCQTLSVTSWFSGFWRTKPMRCACSHWSSASSGRPSNKISPERPPWGVSAGFSWCSRVLLPQPEGPQRTRNSPGWTDSVIFSSAGRVCSG